MSSSPPQLPFSLKPVSSAATVVSSEERIERLEKRLARERAARNEAEGLLENKSRELFSLNSLLTSLNKRLEDEVERRTSELRDALSSAQAEKQKSEFLAHHDALTGLPNRRMLRQFLDGLKSTTVDHGQTAALLHIDLDRFKQINDTYGHAAGDFVLEHVAGTLRSLTTSNEIVCRLGGDEFIIACTMRPCSVRPVDLAHEIVRRLAVPIEFEGALLRFGASVGISKALLDDINLSKLISHADLALYRAKESGRGCVEVFSPELENRMSQRKRLADQICEAIEQSEFVPHYQPRFDAKTRQIECVEVLARWYHPTRGVLSPNDFLHVADDIGATGEIDDIILSKALVDMRTWRNNGLPIPGLSVNVSHSRLCQPDLLKRLENNKIPYGKVRFELLESVFFDEADDELLSRLNDLRALGIDIEIDDFGSGHASIVGVMRIQPSTIKIDRRLITAMNDDPSSGSVQLVKAIIDIGKSLGLNVVAEGIEKKYQAHLCTYFGCKALQGFLFAEPMSSAAFAQYLRSRVLSDFPFSPAITSLTA